MTDLNIGKAIGEGATGLSSLVDSFGGLLEKMGFPKETNGNKGSKLFHLLVYAMALKGTVDLATGDPGGKFRYFLEWLETGALQTGLVGKKVYLEAKGLVGKGSEAVLDYFNTAYELNGDDRLTSQAELAGFLTKKLPVVVKAIRDWEIPWHDNYVDWCDGKQETFRKSGLFYDNGSIACIGLIVAALLGTIVGTQHESVWLGSIVAVIVLVLTIVTVFFRSTKTSDPAVQAARDSTGGDL